MTRESVPEADRELWRRIAPAREGVRPPVSNLDFAAWLDGRLPPAQAAAVESAVAADPDLRRAALELSELISQPLPSPPQQLAVRARALVGFDVEHQERRVGLLDWLLAGGRGFLVQRVATLAAAVVVAISGFLLGGGLGASLVEERHVVSANASNTSAASSSDPTEFLGSDGI